MSITNIFTLLGGLGLFLFGMKYMGDGLELAAGPKMKDLLEKLTRNRVMGFLLGMLVTVVIQSSSATTVMVMGFINAGIMDLAHATSVIFGANIGTTITSVLIALDVSAIAPICIGVGAIMMLYAGKKQWRHVGQVILGFGILFQGLHTMSEAMSFLKDSAAFQSFIMNATNPFLGFLIGVILCAIIQSSSAAVGVIQALGMQGLMPLYFAAFIVCGINVGSSTPPLLSALNAKNNAKRAAVIYLVFNLVGAILFIPLTMFTPLTSVIETHIADSAFQISLYHILFKVVTGLLLLPFVSMVVKATYKIIPIHPHESAMCFMYIDPNMIGSPAVLQLQLEKEIERMADLVEDNLNDAMEGVFTQDLSQAHKIRDNEQVIDFLASEITNYLTRVSALELPVAASKYLGCCYQVINDLEQIGDHAVKILGENERFVESKMTYSEEARLELKEIFDTDMRLLDLAIGYFHSRKISAQEWINIRRTERFVSKQASTAQLNHLERVRKGECTFERGLVFIETINSLLRIVNHTINIVQADAGDSLATALQAEQQKRLSAE